MPSTESPLTDEEIDELEQFLLNAEGIEESMDVATLDGFLTAIVCGPRAVMPGEWLRWVWDMEKGEDAPDPPAGRLVAGSPPGSFGARGRVAEKSLQRKPGLGSIDIEITVNRYNGLDPEAGTRFGERCIGEIERQVPVLADNLDDATKAPGLELDQSQPSAFRPFEEIELGVMPHAGSEQRGSLGHHRDSGQEPEIRMIAEKRHYALVVRVAAVEQGEQRPAIRERGVSHP